jgi:hypothetical protein
MQITNSGATDMHRVHEVHVELDEATALPVALEVILVRQIDGIQVGEPSYSMTAEELQTWLDGTPEAGLTRGDDIAKSLLAWVISTGHVTGSVA